jgi:hypothetical protein
MGLGKKNKGEFACRELPAGFCFLQGRTKGINSRVRLAPLIFFKRTQSDLTPILQYGRFRAMVANLP